MISKLTEAVTAPAPGATTARKAKRGDAHRHRRAPGVGVEIPQAQRCPAFEALLAALGVKAHPVPLTARQRAGLDALPDPTP